MKKTIMLLLVLVVFAWPINAQLTRKLLDSVLTYTITRSDSAKYWKKLYQYDNDGRVIYEGEYSSSRGQKTWQTEEYTQRIFNSDGLAIEVENYRRAVPWTYIDQYLHYNRTYDRYGNLRIDSISIKNIQTNEWYPWMKKENTFNNKNQAVRTFSWSWNYRNETWFQPSKTDYKYNSNGNLLSQIRSGWDGKNNEWTHSPNYGWFEYDDEGRMTKRYYRSIDYDIPVEYYIEYSYPTDTTKNIENYKKHRSDSVFWLISYEEQLFKPDGRIVYHIVELSERASGELRPKEKQTWQYDEDDDITYLNTEEWINNKWRIKKRAIYYYNTLLSNQLLNHDLDYVLYPNPTTDVINITGLSQPVAIELYSIHGRLLKSINQVENSIDISDLPAGVYILNLTLWNKATKRNIIVKR